MEEGGLMSLVLIVAMEDFVIFMSDGRVTQNRTSKGVEILKEDFKKLVKLNTNVCIGFAGSKGPCEEVLKTLSDYNRDSMNIDTVFEVLYEKARSVYSKYLISGIQIKLLMVIGGEQCGEFKFKTFSSNDNFEVLNYNPQGTDLNYAMLSPDNVDISSLINQIYKNAPVTIENLQKAMGECIDNVSQFNNTINNVKFSEIIRR